MLSASVTFLSLPGLDGVTRTAAMVAILFAAFALAATGVAVLRHKAELERPVSHVGVEGVVGVSVCRILLFVTMRSLNVWFSSGEPLYFHYLSFFWPTLSLHSSPVSLCILSVAKPVLHPRGFLSMTTRGGL